MKTFSYKKQSFFNRVKEAGRVISGKQTAPSWKMRDLQNIVTYAVQKSRSERRLKNEYGAGGEGRLREDWDSRTDTPYTELTSKHIKIVARSRDLYKNDTTYRGAINTIIDNVIGAGLWPKPKAKGPDGKLNVELNKKIEYYFNIYSKPGQWDARKKFIYVGDGQRLILRTILLSGDVFLNKVKNNSASPVVPFSWQVFEVDRLDNSRDTFLRSNFDAKDVAQTVHGINIDKYGAEISYNIKGISKAIPAGQILHSCMVDRPEQYVGLPAAVAALTDIFDKKDLMEDYVLKSRAIAKVLWFLSNENDQIPYGDDADSNGALEIDSLSQMRGDKAPDSMKLPDSVSDTIQPLAKMLMHGITSSLGTSYTTVTRDMDGVNFAASKFIDIQEWRHYTALKDYFIYDHCVPFYENFVNDLILSNKVPELNASFYRSNPEMLMDVEWVGNGKMDVDPLKDITADIEGLSNGILTLEDCVTKRGKDLDEHLDKLQEIKGKIEERGLAFAFMVSETSKKLALEEPKNEK